jgi:hypothetical protein
VKRILLLVVALGALAEGRGLEEPWSYGDHNGWGGAFYSNIARNYLRYGYVETRLAPVVTTGHVPPDERSYYLTHPPFIGLALSLSFRAFGEHEWSARLVPLLFSLASTILIYRLGSRLVSKELGLLWSALFTFLPIQILYGAHVDPQGPPVLFFGLLLLLAYVERKLLLAIVALGLGAGFDWPIHYLAGILALHAWFLRERDRRWTVALLGSSLLAVGSWLVYARVVSPKPRQQYLHSTVGDSFLFWSGMRVRRGRIPGRAIEVPSARAWIERMASHFRSLFSLPLLGLAVLGAAASGRREGAQAPHWILLLWGLAHVLIFPVGAYVHDYWSMYLAPGLSFAAAVGLLRIADAIPRRRNLLVAVSTAGLSAFLLVAGIRLVDHLPKEPVVLGKKLRELTPPDGGILLLHPMDARDAYYADRVVREGVNRVGLFKDALKERVRYAYFVVPSEILRLRPRKPLFHIVKACCPSYELGEYALFDLAPLASSRPGN